MNRIVNLSVGFIMLIGIGAFGYLSVTFGEVGLFSPDQYKVQTEFSSVSGLNPNTTVELSGIPVGTVKSIKLHDYNARVTLMIDRDVDLPEDTIAKIRTRGLLGENYVSLNPGGLSRMIPKDGSGWIRETQPPIALDQLIGKLMFSSGSGENNE